jgi:hypothetical protein
MTGSEQTRRPASAGGRAARLALALKANMARRKAQATLRAADDGDTASEPPPGTGAEPEENPEETQEKGQG